MSHMHVTQAGREMMETFEGLRLVAYDDGGGVWTIGYGTTVYPPWHLEGRRVRQGDACSPVQADDFFAHDLEASERETDRLTIDRIQPRQFDALTSFVYNLGAPAFRDSTLRKLVNAAPDEPAIRGQFMRWHYQRENGVLVPKLGLWQRRHREADHYFGAVTECPPFPPAKAA